MSILNPLHVEAILIKSSNTLFVSEDAFASKLKVKNSSLINSIIRKISREINQAKLTHKKIESYFIPAMNFKKLSTFTDNLIIEMENYLNKS